MKFLSTRSSFRRKLNESLLFKDSLTQDTSSVLCTVSVLSCFMAPNVSREIPAEECTIPDGNRCGVSPFHYLLTDGSQLLTSWTTGPAKQTALLWEQVVLTTLTDPSPRAQEDEDSRTTVISVRCVRTVAGLLFPSMLPSQSERGGKQTSVGAGHKHTAAQEERKRRLPRFNPVWPTSPSTPP